MYKCVVCDVELNGNRRKFCSVNCSNRFKYENNKEELNTNSYARQISKYRFRKFKLIELRDNKGCSKCGYLNNISALDFHHINPIEKKFPLDGRTLSNRSWDSILVEFNKCIILCANCHREEHNPELNFEDRDNYFEVDETLKKNNHCVDCSIEIDCKATRCVKCYNISSRKIERPSKDILQLEVIELGYSATGRKYGVSDNTIRKWLK